MTVALLDRLAPLVRELLGVERSGLPAGAHARGRHLGGRAAGSPPSAAPDGGPPFTIISDGTVF